MLENISHKFYKKGLENIKSREEYEQGLIEKAKELFTKSELIGEGNFANVYNDPENKSCFKVVLRFRENLLNNVEEEAEFLDELADTHEDAKVPFPNYTITATSIENRSGKQLQQRKQILNMEEIIGPTLDEVLRNKKQLPKSFDHEKFFTALSSFVSMMHEKYGIHHRDLRAPNVMIEEETGKPVIVDFGSAVKIILKDEDPYAREPGMEKIAPFFKDEEQLASLRSEMRTHLVMNKLL